MLGDQLDLFGCLYEDFHIKNTVRLIECFGGIGAQARAFEILGVPFEHHRLVEWAVPSIRGYNAIHIHDWNDYSQGKSVDDLVKLTNGVSVTYNDPMTEQQRRKKGEKWLRETYSMMVATHDYCPDVSRVHWNDLGITERESYTYVLSYSFPCQDLSNAGKLAGMKKGSGTRSGLLWEIERILLECKEHNCLPHVLLMENVRGVLSDKDSWGSWEASLRRMGYTNYVTSPTMNSKDYGIPQNRERVFMISILGDYGYQFPTPFKRKHNLKSFLDKNVDEKFYLSKEHLDNIANWKAQQDPLKDIDKPKEVVHTLTARGAGEEHSGMVLINEEVEGVKVVGNYSKSGNFAQRMVVSDKGICNTVTTGNHGEPTAVELSESEIVNYGVMPNTKGKFHQSQALYGTEGVCATIMARDYKDPHRIVDTIPIKEATVKGYKEAKVGDGVDISSRMNTHRGTVQNGMCQTLKTTVDVGVVVRVGGIFDKDGERHQAGSVYEPNGLSPCLDTAGGGYREPIILDDKPSQD